MMKTKEPEYFLKGKGKWGKSILGSNLINCGDKYRAVNELGL